jgi:cytidylate kinase
MTLTQALEQLKGTNPLRITIGGDIGSGKSTFAKRLATELQVPRVNIGGLMREEAQRRGITLQALEALQAKDDALDKQMDEFQRIKGRETPRGIFEGRTSWHFVENPNVKVFMAVRPEIAVDRVFEDTANPLRDTFKTKAELQKADEVRKQSLIHRFETFYGIDIFNPANFDLVIDTSDIGIEEVYEQTVVKIAQFLGAS